MFDNGKEGHKLDYRKKVNHKVNHLAIIMDGNGRWAEKKGDKRIIGHYFGEKKFEEVCRWVAARDIEHFTVYAFSTENRKRPKEEVDAIMNLLEKYFKTCLAMSLQFSYKVDVIGRKNDLSDEVIDLINAVEEKTQNNNGLNIHIAVNYGGRDELVRAFEKMYAYTKEQGVFACSENEIEKYLDFYGITNPDIVIRTGGEKRLSNFMLWELAYSELFFIDSYWPDFSEDDLDNILNDYLLRNRKYGALV